MWRAVPEACQEDHSHGDSEFIVNQLNIRGCRYVAFKPWPAVSPEENSNRSLPPRSLRPSSKAANHTQLSLPPHAQPTKPQRMCCAGPHLHAGQNGGYGYVKLCTNQYASPAKAWAPARSSAPIRPSAACRRLHHARRIQSMHIPGQVGPALLPLVPSIKCQPRFLPLSLSLPPCGSRRQVQGGEREKREDWVCGGARRRRRRSRIRRRPRGRSLPPAPSPPAISVVCLGIALFFLPVLNFEFVTGRACGHEEL
jgi:hypothetical protein